MNGDATVQSSFERRRRKRADLICPLYAVREQDDEQFLVGGRTENLSSHGFYCLLGTEFSVGDRIRCVIAINRLGTNQSEFTIGCVARVLRVEPRSELLFGMACEIDEYWVSIAISSESSQHHSSSIGSVIAERW